MGKIQLTEQMLEDAEEVILYDFENYKENFVPAHNQFQVLITDEHIFDDGEFQLQCIARYYFDKDRYVDFFEQTPTITDNLSIQFTCEHDDDFYNYYSTYESESSIYTDFVAGYRCHNMFFEETDDFDNETLQQFIFEKILKVIDNEGIYWEFKKSKRYREAVKNNKKKVVK